MWFVRSWIGSAIEQRPHKSPENEGGKGQKSLGKGGAAHLKEESRAGTTEEVSRSMRIQEVDSVGRSPGLRAYRVSGAGSRSSHGSSSSAGPSTSAGPPTEERRELRVPPGLSPFPEGDLFDDASGLMEQSQPGSSQRRALTEDERNRLNKEVRDRIQSLEERVDRLTLDDENTKKRYGGKIEEKKEKASAGQMFEGMQRALVPAEKPYKNKDGAVEYPPWKSLAAERTPEAQRGEERTTGGMIPQVVMGGPPATSWTSSTTSLGGGYPRSIWGTEQYQYCPTGHDRWDLTKLSEGWVIRIHGRNRKRRFHPLHGSLPVDAGDLEGERITKRFIKGGGADVFCDKWTGNNVTEDNATWSGYTFLKLKMKDDEPQESDGSFEKINE